ncbi:Basic helix-loop-helix transcription factor [Trema orientale]|uniref:Basic helix-loop-helix transcription factor n=1 Tax=Trema orientale TaxID=63057 RepID=A0A2P5ERA9_TREOI|nr:Basic helix-loop-helix transcription factor [Trema orientale]
MFPLHRSNELCFQISPNPQKKNTISSEDLILGHASLEDNAFHVSNYKNINSHRNPRSLPKSNGTIVNHNSTTTTTQNSGDSKNKKMMRHRDIERQRRQEMATLHASLRSLLPLELIKGKRSISDHIHEAARYIKQLQMRIKELGNKRDYLKKYYLSNSSSTGPTDNGGAGSSSGSTPPPAQGHLLRVQTCCGGVEIMVSNSDFAGDQASGLPLSRVLEVILEEGLSLVSCVSTKVNGRLLHTVHSEASNIECINLSALEQKLSEVIYP